MKRMLCGHLCLGLAISVVGSALAQPAPEPKDGLDPTAKLGKLTLTIDPGRHTSPVARAFFDPSDGNQLITLGRDDGAIRLWNVAESRTASIIYPPGSPYSSRATMSQDGKRLAVPVRYLENGKDVHVIYVLGLPGGRLEKVLRGHPGQVRALAFAPDGQRLASHSTPNDGVLLSDLTRDVPPELVLKGKVVSGLAFSPDGQRLAWVRDQNGAILDLKSGQELPLDLKSKQTQGGCHVAWSADGKTIGTATVLGGDVRLHDAKGKLLHSAKHPGYGLDLRFSPDSTKLLIVGSSGTNQHLATLLDVETAKVLVSFQPGAIGSSGGAFSADGQFVATVGGLDDRVQIFVWRPKNVEIYRQLKGEAWITGGFAFEQPAWSKDGKGACWCSAQRGFGNKLPQFGQATFDLAELGFGPTLGKEQRYTSVLEKDGVMEKDGLTLKRNGKNIQVLKDGKVIRQYASTAASLLGKGLLFNKNLTGDVSWVNALTGLGGALSPDGRYLLRINSATQYLTIVPAEQAKPLFTLYRKGPDWIIWTEEGYYAATPGGERLMGWKVDNGIGQMPAFYPAERFRKQLYRPDVIKKAFELGSVAEALKALDGKMARPGNLEQMLPPTAQVQIIDKSKLPKLRVKASAVAAAKGQPVTALRLLVDGRPLPNREAYTEGKTEDTWEITLPPGKHTLAVLAKSPDASAVSNSIDVTFINKEDLPILHVLTIGVSKYQQANLKLDFAAKDAQDLLTAFDKVGKGDLFGAVKGQPLLDEKATAANIIAEMTALRKRVKPNDLVVVFFAGHGVKEKDKFYLLPVDTNTQALAKTAISGAALRKSLGEFPCQVLLMLDACHSALGVKAFRPAVDDVTRALTDDECGVVVMCSAMANQVALEKNGNGLFTRAVVAALQGGPKVPRHERTGRFYLHHLKSFVFDRVLDESDERQHPFMSVPWVVPSFAVAQFAAPVHQVKD